MMLSEPKRKRNERTELQEQADEKQKRSRCTCGKKRLSERDNFIPGFDLYLTIMRIVLL